MTVSKPPPQRYEATDAAAKPEASTAERYRPERERTGTALCLSGGGFRATLFHLGALRRLNETGVLAKLDTVSSVSGGSIMAAMACGGCMNFSLRRPSRLTANGGWPGRMVCRAVIAA